MNRDYTKKIPKCSDFKIRNRDGAFSIQYNLDTQVLFKKKIAKTTEDCIKLNLNSIRAK